MCNYFIKAELPWKNSKKYILIAEYVKWSVKREKERKISYLVTSGEKN